MNTQLASGCRTAAASSRGLSAQQYGQVNEPNSITSGFDFHRSASRTASPLSSRGRVKSSAASPAWKLPRNAASSRSCPPSANSTIEVRVVVGSRIDYARRTRSHLSSMRLRWYIGQYGRAFRFRQRKEANTDKLSASKYAIMVPLPVWPHPRG